MGKARRKTRHSLRLTDLWSRVPSLPPEISPIVAASTEVEFPFGNLDSSSRSMDNNTRSNSELGARRDAVNLVSPLTLSPSHPINEHGLVPPSLCGSPPSVSTFNYVLPRMRKYRNSVHTNDQTRMQYKRRRGCPLCAAPYSNLPCRDTTAGPYTLHVMTSITVPQAPVGCLLTRVPISVLPTTPTAPLPSPTDMHWTLLGGPPQASSDGQPYTDQDIGSDADRHHRVPPRSSTPEPTDGLSSSDIKAIPRHSSHIAPLPSPRAGTVGSCFEGK